MLYVTGKYMHGLNEKNLLKNYHCDFFFSVKTMVTYLCERLQDHHSIQPQALKGILTLVGQEQFHFDCMLVYLLSRTSTILM